MEDIIFRLNDKSASADQITDLYGKIGWNNNNQRTVDKTSQILKQSILYVTASIEGEVIGFGRILGDAYTAQILDVITDPRYRNRGIATQMMKMLMKEAEGRFLGISLIDGTGFPRFYERFGFTEANTSTDRLMYWQPPSKK